MTAKLESIETYSYPVPFRTVFRHASASRAHAENIVVAVRNADGVVGYGEGCPRQYVTGEDVGSAVSFVDRVRRDVLDAIGDPASLTRWIADRRDDIDRNPAAFCALELALLDLFGKIEHRPVEDLIGLPSLEHPAVYSAVLGDAPWLIYRMQLWRYLKAGFRDFKIKLSGSPTRDRRKLAPFRRASRAKSVGAPVCRVDANNLWQTADEAIRHLQALDSRFVGVEEPLRPGDLSGCRQVAEACDTRVILDESAARLADIERLDDPSTWIVNVRVSKMGGLIRAAECIRAASACGVGIIVGAQVGETSILTRAGLAAISAAGADLIAAEGGFGTHLLQRDIVARPVMFGDGGVLDPADHAFAGAPGLGLDIDRGGLEDFREGAG